MEIERSRVAVSGKDCDPGFAFPGNDNIIERVGQLLLLMHPCLFFYTQHEGPFVLRRVPLKELDVSEIRRDGVIVMDAYMHLPV